MITIFLDEKKIKERRLKKQNGIKNVPLQRVCSKPHNLICNLPGVKGTTRMAKTPLKCWSCVMDDEILSIILQQTN